jgi:hypothetical protein
LCFIRYVAGETEGVTALPLDVGGALFGFVRLGIDTHELCPFRRQPEGNPTANIRAGAGDQSDLAVEFHSVPPMLRE